MKSSINPEAEILALLKKVLPSATDDPDTAGRIYKAVEAQLILKSQVKAFEKFCKLAELPDLKPESIAVIKTQLHQGYGDVETFLKPAEDGKSLAVQVSLDSGHQLCGNIEVHPLDKTSEEQEIKLGFTPFPVALPGDKETVWVLAKKENMTAEEGAIALDKLQGDFWASRTGQKLIRDRIERSFPEFISRVPAGALKEMNLKRLFKLPEPVKVLHNPVTQ